MILHFSTVHPRVDLRIRHKEVGALNDAYPGKVALYVMDGLGDELDTRGFRIVDVGPRPKGRLRRALIGGWRMYRAVRAARPTIAHFHDPELLPWGMLLSLQGIKVIYDAHEDVPRQILHKHYLSRPLAITLSAVAEITERIAARFMTAIIVVVPAILKRFPRKKTVLVANFPRPEEFLSASATQEKEPRFVYAGGVTEARGAVAMVESIGLLNDSDARLTILGDFQPVELEEKTRRLPGWAKVDALGWSDRKTVAAEYARSCAGLVLLEPKPQYVISYPVKMFEYMAAGLPVIASDFPLWREIMEDADCGLLVDPRDPHAIAKAMQWILDHPEDAAEMGRNGKKVVQERYNWEAESDKLVALYERVLSDQ